MAETNGAYSPLKFAGDVVPLWLDGKEIKTSATIDLVSPLTEKVLYQAAAANESDALAAVAAAEKALPAWKMTKPAFRRDLFLAAAAELLRRKDDFWYFCSSETGSTVRVTIESVALIFTDHLTSHLTLTSTSTMRSRR